MLYIELLQFIQDNANATMLADQELKNQFKQALGHSINHLDKYVPANKRGSLVILLKPIVDVMVISHQHDEELYSLCLRKLARLLQNEDIAIEVIKQERLIPLLLSYLDDFKRSAMNTNQNRNYEHPIRILKLLLPCMVISAEVNQKLVFTHDLIPKVLSVFVLDDEKKSAFELNQRIIFLFSHLINSSTDSVRKEIINHDIVHKFLPYFDSDRVWLRELSYYPTELRFDALDEEKIRAMCKANLNFHQTLKDIDSLIILHNLDSEHTIIQELKFNKLDLEELSRVALKIFTKQGQSPRTLIDVDISKVKSKDGAIYRDLNYILTPLNCLVTFEANRSALFSPELVRTLVYASTKLSILTLSNRVHIARILHKFALSVPSDQAEDAFGTMDNYNKFKNVYDAFNTLQVHRFFTSVEKRLPKHAMQLIGNYNLGGVSL